MGNRATLLQGATRIAGSLEQFATALSNLLDASPVDDEQEERGRLLVRRRLEEMQPLLDAADSAAPIAQTLRRVAPALAKRLTAARSRAVQQVRAAERWLEGSV